MLIRHRISRWCWTHLMAAFCLVSAPQVRAQSAIELSGTVIANGAPVASAQVATTDLNGRGASALTTSDGRFRLVVPGPGQYQLVVRALGFEPVTQSVRAGSATAPLEIRLVRAAQLQAVQVVGTGAAQTRLHPSADALAGSVSVLTGEQIARENVAFSQELLRKVPGVYRAEFNQGVVAGDIGIRGFNTESEIGSAKLLIDGIPSNLNSGVSEMNALFPLEIARIDVVRGTNDPRFGLFNLAGNIGVETQQATSSFLTSRLQGGSFGATEAQLLSGATCGGFSQTLFGGFRRADGFRENAGSEK
jgi:outer membrane receptor protein involved in Fe transport